MQDANNLLRAYLIVGKDDLKRKAAVSRLRRYVDEGLAAFNLDERTAASDMVPEELVASLSQMAVGSPVRLVIVHEAEKMPKAVSEALIAYLARPNPSCTLALESESLAKNTRLYKAVAAMGAKAVVDCSPKKRWELPDHVARMARSMGVTLGSGAAEELVSRVGESTTMLETQLATLAALMPGQTIRRRDVVANVSRVAEVKPWDFLDALSAREAGRSVQLYRLMAEQGVSKIGLLTLVEGRLRELVCARALAARGGRVSQDDVAAALSRSGRKRQGWQVKNHVRWARGFGEGELPRLLARCAACERTLKGTGDDDEALLRLILSVCGR